MIEKWKPFPNYNTRYGYIYIYGGLRRMMNMKIRIKSPIWGVPITFVDKYNPDQFEIVAFRKGDDGKDLVFTREREREFNRTFVSLYDLDCRDDKKRRRQNQWEAYLRQNNNQAEIEPIDYFFPMPWQMSGKDRASVNGKLTYARVFIRKKVGA